MALEARSVTEQLRGVLMGYVSSITADSVLKAALRRVGRSTSDIDREGLDEPMVLELGRGLAFFLGSEDERRASMTKLGEVLHAALPARGAPGATVEIVDESGIVDARTQARNLARDLGFGRVDQAKIATCVSELARNIFSYAKTGRIQLVALNVPRAGLRVVASDSGPGIPNLEEVLSGRYQSRTGLGLGIVGCKKLMDEFEIRSSAGAGTVVTLAKYVP